MATACVKCNGTGYGYLDSEFGHRGTDPCPACQGKLDERAEGGEFDTQDRRGKTVKGEAPTLGRPVKLPAEKKKTVDFVDGPGKAGVDEEGMTVEEAVEAGVFSQSEVDAQNEVDLAAMGGGTGEGGEGSE